MKRFYVYLHKPEYIPVTGAKGEVAGSPKRELALFTGLTNDWARQLCERLNEDPQRLQDGLQASYTLEF